MDQPAGDGGDDGFSQLLGGLTGIWKRSWAGTLLPNMWLCCLSGKGPFCTFGS